MIRTLVAEWVSRTGTALTAAALAGLCAACSGEPPKKGPSVPPPPIPESEPSPFVKGPAGRIFVEDGGSGGGLPVLLVHGLAGDHNVWAAQVEALRRNRRAATLDLRGFGQSDRDPNGDYTIPAFAADVAAVAEQLNIPRYVLVGHSMSGPVIAEVARNHPDRVAGLVFDDPAGDLSKFPQKDLDAWLAGFTPEKYDLFREEWFGEMLETARPEVRTAVMATMRKAKREVVEASARGLAAYDPKPAMKAYPGPMLAIVVPENDKPQSLQKLAPSVKVIKVKNTSHWIMMDKPEEFNAALEEFLEGIPESR